MASNLDFELINPTKEFLYSGEIWTKLSIARKTEGSYLKKLLGLAQKGKTNITLLVKNSQIYGLIALSASRIADLPAVQVDYLFVSSQYRKQEIDKLSNLKISQYLINYAIQISVDIKEKIGVNFLLLLPADDKLIKTYEAMNFKQLHSKTQWMVLKLA
ncbi:MAG: hypothetical protein RL154_1433 [Pseudomonadota bacterium]|jgi:hypothetical protein